MTHNEPTPHRVNWLTPRLLKWHTFGPRVYYRYEKYNKWLFSKSTKSRSDIENLDWKLRLKIFSIIQLGHKRCRPLLNMGWKNAPPPISKYFSEIFSPSNIKLTNKTRIWTLNRSSDRRNSRILNNSKI